MRTATIVLLVGMTVMLLSCGLLRDGEQVSEDSEAGASSQATVMGSSVAPSVGSTIAYDGPTSLEEEQVSEDSEASASSQETLVGSPVTPAVQSAIAYLGPTSLEERVLVSPVIARVRLDSATSTVESGPTYRGMKYIALVEFSFSVLEYLKGSGASDIVAIWNAGQIFDTRQEAEAALPLIGMARDTQWDGREAIVFLQHTVTYLPSTQQAGRFYLSGEHHVGGVPDDYYSIASRGNKLWLPAAATVGAPSQLGSDQQRFLLDVPPALGAAPTITLGEIQARIAGVAAKLDAGDGSEEFRNCVRRTYQYEGYDRYSIERGGDGYFSRTLVRELDSGLPASSVVYEESPVFGGLPDKQGRVWLDGGDAALFSAEIGDGVPYDFSGDGVNDTIQYAQRVMSTRPLPAGAYRFNFYNREVDFVVCDGYTFRDEWTVAVTAPEGTLHEAFFDPVAVGTTVAADSANGVLKPASFIDANGAAATIERIAWEAGTGESGTVKLKLSPHNGIAGHTLHFIAHDGSAPLSLKVADATVDSANDTLSWAVASQPWDHGDKLMLRIR